MPGSGAERRQGAAALSCELRRCHQRIEHTQRTAGRFPELSPGTGLPKNFFIDKIAEKEGQAAFRLPGFAVSESSQRKGPQTDPLAGSEIRRIRLSLHMTQADFAVMLGISVSYLRSLENGRRRPSLRVLNALHCRLSLSYDQLFDEDRDSADMLREPGYGDGNAVSPQSVRRMLALILSRCSDEDLLLCYDAVCSVLRRSAQIRPVKEAPDTAVRGEKKPSSRGPAMQRPREDGGQ